MGERYGSRPPQDVDKEWPTENPIKPWPGDNTTPTDDSTTPNVGDGLGDLDDTAPLPPASFSDTGGTTGDNLPAASDVGAELGALDAPGSPPPGDMLPEP